MNIKYITQITPGQDGAIWGNHLFRLSNRGHCSVHDLDDSEFKKIAEFDLDKSDIIAPHCNAVVFGNEYFSPEDEYPLLYSNIYNNYANAEDKLKGVCCVYRVTRDGERFSTQLVQMIKIGFVENTELWKSSAEKEDVRPYGNFVIDRENGLYYGFTMRDECNSTRYFSFKLPKLSDGSYSEKYNVNTVTLSEDDIICHFDCEYHKFIQGACMNRGLIYSLEGFYDGHENIPAIRIIDPESKSQKLYSKFADFGLKKEPEFIDFRDEKCYYGDCDGNLYIIEF